MKKGLSVWLFSKMVMLAFLILIFALMSGFLTILTERAYSDSALVLTFQIKEAVLSVSSSNTVSIQRVVPLPKFLPDDKMSNKRAYYLVIKKASSGGNNVVFAITKGIFYANTFVASSSLFLTSGVSTNLAGSSAFKINSNDFHFFVVQKKNNKISFYACNKTYSHYDSSGSTTYGFQQCISPNHLNANEIVTF